MTNLELQFPEQLVCQRALYANSCFDTGAPPILTLTSEQGAALWVFETEETEDATRYRVLVPGECGKAAALGWSSATALHRAYAIAADGSIRMSANFAGTEPQPLPEAELARVSTGSAGSFDAACSFFPRTPAGPENGRVGWAVLLLPALLLTRRRIVGRQRVTTARVG